MSDLDVHNVALSARCLAPKGKQTTEEQKCQDQSYEKRCKRGFGDDWKVNRPWLMVETNAGGDEIMFCDLCESKHFFRQNIICERMYKFEMIIT